MKVSSANHLFGYKPSVEKIGVFVGVFFVIVLHICYSALTLLLGILSARAVLLL